MLQINTGKLFIRGVRRTNALRGVLYSNGWFHFNDVETAAGTLRATGGERGDLAVVYELEERIENAKEEPGILVSHGVTPLPARLCSSRLFWVKPHRINRRKCGSKTYK